jgi:hypothetical protein
MNNKKIHKLFIDFDVHMQRVIRNFLLLLEISNKEIFFNFSASFSRFNLYSVCHQ